MKRLALLLAWLVAGCAAPSADLTLAGEVSRSDTHGVAELSDLEQQIENAVSRRDHVFLDGVTASTFTRTDQDGKVENRADVMSQIRQPPPTADVIMRTIDRATQRVELHGDIAVTRGGLEVRGPRRAFRTTYLRVYRRQGAGWQLLSNTTLSMTPLVP